MSEQPTKFPSLASLRLRAAADHDDLLPTDVHPILFGLLELVELEYGPEEALMIMADLAMELHLVMGDMLQLGSQTCSG